MLITSIILFIFALAAASLGTIATVGSGAYAFSFGFLVISAIAGLSYWRGHPGSIGMNRPTRA